MIKKNINKFIFISDQSVSEDIGEKISEMLFVLYSINTKEIEERASERVQDLNKNHYKNLIQQAEDGIRTGRERRVENKKIKEQWDKRSELTASAVIYFGGALLATCIGLCNKKIQSGCGSLLNFLIPSGNSLLQQYLGGLSEKQNFSETPAKVCYAIGGLLCLGALRKVWQRHKKVKSLRELVKI